LFVIDEKGEQLGVITKIKALELAEKVSLDIVEVSPNAKPPVAKIMSWSKFKYKQSKKRKGSKSKKTEQKEMWFKSFIAVGDLKHKVKKVREFLTKKHPVKITVRGKGRISSTQMNDLMKSILTELQDLIEIDSRPKFQGRNLTLIVRPISNN